MPETPEVARLAKIIHDVIENDDDSDGGAYARAARQILASLQPSVSEMRLREALKSANSWLERWATHAGNCVGGCIGDAHCTCGLVAIRHETRSALSPEG